MNTFCPKDQNEWRNWLKENHKKEDFVWLIFYKKSSPKCNLSWSEAVDQALCYGWIDSTKKSIDDEKYQQYYCKRKPKSNWSKVNKDKVKVLIKNMLMREAGTKSIEIAKENGSWTYLDDVEALIIPGDLRKALESKKGAMEFFDSISNSSKKNALYWVLSGKRAETRQKRINEIAENASKKINPKSIW